MGMGRIISHIGEGLYHIALKINVAKFKLQITLLEQRDTDLRAKLLQDRADRIDLRDAARQAENEAANTYTAWLCSLPTDQPPPAPPSAVTALMQAATQAQGKLRNQDAIIERQELLLLSIQKRLNVLRASADEEQMTTAWCADYNTELTGEVKTLEPPGGQLLNPLMVNIAPDHPDAQLPDYGQLSPAMSNTPSGWAYNYMLMGFCQKMSPTWRYGIITAIDYGADTCSVQLVSRGVRNLDINQNKEFFLTEVPIRYMTSDSLTFEVGDEVVVQFTGFDWAQRQVIGYRKEPRQSCGFVCVPADKDGNAYDPRPTLISSAKGVNRLRYQNPAAERYVQSGGNQHYFPRRLVNGEWKTTGDVYSWLGSSTGDLVDSDSSSSEIYKNGYRFKPLSDELGSTNKGVIGFSTKTLKYKEGNVDKVLKVYIVGVIDYDADEKLSIYCYTIEENKAVVLTSFDLFSPTPSDSLTFCQLRFNYESTECSIIVYVEDTTNKKLGENITAYHKTITISYNEKSVTFSMNDVVIERATVERSRVQTEFELNETVNCSEKSFPIGLNYKNGTELSIMSYIVRFDESRIVYYEATDNIGSDNRTRIKSMNVYEKISVGSLSLVFEKISDHTRNEYYQVLNPSSMSWEWRDTVMNTDTFKEYCIYYADISNDFFIYQEVIQNCNLSRIVYYINSGNPNYIAGGNSVIDKLHSFMIKSYIYNKGVITEIKEHEASGTLNEEGSSEVTWCDYTRTVNANIMGFSFTDTSNLNSSGYVESGANYHYPTTFYNKNTLGVETRSLAMTNTTEIFLHGVYNSVNLSGYGVTSNDNVNAVIDERAIDKDNNKSTLVCFVSTKQQYPPQVENIKSHTTINETPIQSIKFKPDKEPRNYIHGKYSEFSNPDLQLLNIGLY